MGTNVRNEISVRSPYHIPKHRMLELKHFCLQYPEWKRLYLESVECSGVSGKLGEACTDVEWSDPTGKTAIFKESLAKNMNLVEEVAHKTDPGIEDYILRAVTEDLSFTYLKTVLNIPCSKNYYYDKYRRFFYILDKKVA